MMAASPDDKSGCAVPSDITKRSDAALMLKFGSLNLGLGTTM